MKNYKSDYLIDNSVLTNVLESKTAFTYDGVDVAALTLADFNQRTFLDEQTKGKPNLDLAQKNFIKDEVVTILSKISAVEWNGELLRKETLILRKYYLINFLRNRAWLRLLGNQTDRWVKAIEQAVNLDINQIMTDANFNYNNFEIPIIVQWFMTKSIFNFYNLSEQLSCFSPSNLLAQIPFETVEEGKESVFDIIYQTNKFIPFSLFSLISKNRILVISAEEIYNIYKGTIAQMLSGKGERPKTVFNYFGYDQGLGFEKPLVDYINHQVIDQNENKHNLDLKLIKTAIEHNFQFQDTNDVLKFKVKDFSYKNTHAFISVLVAGIGLEPCIFADKTKMQQFCQKIVDSYSVIEGWIKKCEETNKIFNDEIIRNNLLSEYAVWKTMTNETYTNLSNLIKKLK